jgi:hypothetical protein
LRFALIHDVGPLMPDLKNQCFKRSAMVLADLNHFKV